jgi:hypothetical protein
VLDASARRVRVKWAWQRAGTGTVMHSELSLSIAILQTPDPIVNMICYQYLRVASIIVLVQKGFQSNKVMIWQLTFTYFPLNPEFTVQPE